MGQKGTGKTTLCKLLATSDTAVWDPLRQYPEEIAYRPRALDRVEFDAFAGAVWRCAPKRILVEEAEQVLPQGAGLPPNFKALAMMGRNIGLTFGANTRRPQRLEKDVLDESDHLFIFKLSGRSLDYMQAYLGRVDGPRLDVMRRWIKDPRAGGGYFWHYHDGDLDLRAPLPAPRLA
jgi:hypothetical protein